MPKALFFDYGLFVCIAQEFAKHGVDTFYYSPWKGSYPTAEKAQIGEGLEGLNNVLQFFDMLKKLDKKEDVVVFPDVGDGDLITHLREDGYNVFGCGKSEIIEINRLELKHILKKVGLPVIPFKHIIGIDNLEKYLKTVTKKYIKTSYYRGLMETLDHVDWNHTKQRIDKLRHDAGAYQDKLEFIVEDAIEDAVELGTEWFMNNKHYLTEGCIGIEIKDKAYIGKFLKLYDLPEPMGEVHDALEDYLARNGMQGMFSTEVRIDKDQTPWFNDFTARAGSPPTESLCNIYENFPEAIIAVAEGEPIKLKAISKYVAQVVLKSDWAITETTYLEFPEKLLGKLVFRNLCKINERYLYIPQDRCNIIGAAIGLGNTPLTAETEALKVAEQLVGDDVFYDKNAFDKADDVMETFEEFGMGKF